MSIKLDPEIEKKWREHFEERMFNARFIAGIEKTGLGGCMTFMANDCPMKVDFVAKNEDGTYKEESLNIAWFGYKIGRIEAYKTIAELEGTAEDAMNMSNRQLIPKSMDEAMKLRIKTLSYLLIVLMFIKYGQLYLELLQS